MSSPAHSDRVYSSYFNDIKQEAKERYRQKLDLLGPAMSDPYATMPRCSAASNNQWSTSSTLWPKVEYPDIYNYLVNTPSPHTKDELKAYKSMEGDKYFVDGWVSQVLVHQVRRCSGEGASKQVSVVSASVKHSQRLSDAPLKPWVAAEMTGTVICAHCTCMAGLGEVCSHIAALRFTLEANTKLNNNVSCTSRLCSWLPTKSQSVHYATISDIDFTPPATKRRRMTGEENCTVDSSVLCSSSLITPKPTDTELTDLHQQLSKLPGKPVLLSLVPGFCNDYIPRSEKGILPHPLTNLFMEEMLEADYSDLLQTCELVFNRLSISLEQTLELEKATRGQHQSKLWFQHRAGHVTASLLKAAVRTDHSQPSRSLIK